MRIIKKGKVYMQNIKYVFLVLFCGMILIGVCGLAFAGLDYSKSENEYENISQEVLISQKPRTATDESSAIDFAALKGKNSEAVGWIEVSETNINYPIAQGVDNQYYLTHSFEKTELTSGSIFLDCASANDFSDYNTLIYGHRMKDGSMFSALGNFAQEGFTLKDVAVKIHTESQTISYEPVFAKIVDSNNKIYSMLSADIDKQAFDDLLLAEYEFFVPDKAAQGYITLSTCTERKGQRVIVVAKRS